jgi:hypothetical protein
MGRDASARQRTGANDCAREYWLRGLDFAQYRQRPLRWSEGRLMGALAISVCVRMARRDLLGTANT